MPAYAPERAKIERELHGLEDEGAEFPTVFQHIWEMFNELTDTRQWTEVGPQSITFLEIDAFSRLLRFSLAPWEVRFIKRIDRLYRTTQQEHRRRDREARKAKK